MVSVSRVEYQAIYLASFRYSRTLSYFTKTMVHETRRKSCPFSRFLQGIYFTASREGIVINIINIPSAVCRSAATNHRGLRGGIHHA